MMMKVEFLIPVYNEEKILERNIKTLKNYLEAQNFDFDWKIAILDNGSSDSTPQILKSLEGGPIIAITTPAPGKGGAIKNYCLQSGADIVVYMDVDLAVSLDCLPRLI
jgi:glycosyltransferase involved in cell wall biosynthesis